METESKLAKAIIEVMKSVKGIEKSSTIGSGNNSYKGVSDQEVKKIIGEAMTKQGLCILPINISANTKVDRWQESYQGQDPRMKQSVHVEVTTKYLLLHESGESMEIAGYGHGVDSQDKAAGKATTYALKYALLYSFLVPTGKIDDADAHHSDNIQTPAVATPVAKQELPAEKVFIQEPIEKIKECKTRKDLTDLYNSMPASQQGTEHIIKAFADKGKDFPKEPREAKKQAPSSR